MATIYVDGRPHQAKEGDNLLHACLSLKFDLPYFCWHPAMGSVGACRQCAVKQFKDEKDTRGRLVMACMTPVTDGMRISIDDPEARAFRASISEWLMVNHPHDCPVCDEGGECHLQDMTVMTGHVYRQHRFPKRTHRNQNLGPFINHEMNRCIQCYRCVRFYRDYAGGRDLDVLAAHDHVYFGRHEDGTLENEFSGNLVEVCPTGVFTDKTLHRHYARKWDLQMAPSVCAHCGLGCNTTPGERYGTLRRIVNRYHDRINGHFLCDRGRFGYEFVNSDRRIRRPLLGGHPASKEDVIRRVASLTPGKLIGIGSPRASLEANFALRALVSPERFYAGLPDPEAALVSSIVEILRSGPAPAASLKDAEEADAALVLGEDVTHTAPRLALSLRQAARRAPVSGIRALGIPDWHDAAVREALQNQRGPLFIATPFATPLDDVAAATLHAAPDDLARLGFAVAHAIDPAAPQVAGLSNGERALAGRIATALAAAKRTVVVSGTSLGSRALIRAAANVAWALKRTGHDAVICFTVPECDALGLSLLQGERLSAAFQAAGDGQVDAVIILENDLCQGADAERVNAFFKAARHVIVLDHLSNGTTERAEAVLPAGTFAECTGTVVSSEGRAQRFFRVMPPQDGVMESWRWLSEIARAAGGRGWDTLADLHAAMARDLPILGGIRDAAPAADFRVHGQKIAREPVRYSGRTAMNADRSVHEPKAPEDSDSPLAHSMEGTPLPPPPALTPFFWAPGWNSIQSVHKFQDEHAPGVRLIEPQAGPEQPYVDWIPDPFQRREGEWLFVPIHHIFGSEELSALAPGIAARMPAPYVAMNPEDGAAEGRRVAFTLSGRRFELPVRSRPDLPRGVAGLPLLPATAGVEFPQKASITTL